MKRPTAAIALCVAGLATAALAQDAAVTTQETVRKTTSVSSIEGKVVRYEPGKTIVVTGADGKETTYILPARLEVPADVQIGRTVSLSTQPSDTGVLVTKITTQSMTPEGNLKTETQTRSTSPSGEEITTKETSITGTVSALEPGKSVTFQLPDQKLVVYTLDGSSIIPSDLAVGGTYTVETASAKNGSRVVKRIVTKTRTTTVQP